MPLLPMVSSPGHPRPLAEGEGEAQGQTRAQTQAVSDAGVDADTNAEASDVSMTTAHLARFEFSEHGTKILMIEWHPGAIHADAANVAPATTSPAPVAGAVVPPHAAASVPAPGLAGTASDADPDDATAWHISWPGKSTVLPATESGRDQDGARRRIYFLLPTDASIPGTVTITGPGRPSLDIKPLPAIFPEGFDFEAGPRGVLHTIWAKKRLSELHREMEAELRANSESVGLEMARAEKQWIIENFLPPPPRSEDGAARTVSPRSPGSLGRLGEKLKGLRLGTSPADLVPSPTANIFTHAGAQSLTLSPTGGDVVVSNFPAVSRTSNTAAPMSLNAALHGDVGVGLSQPESQDGEEDLFALPISPRSPEMKKSPFSTL